MYIYIYIYIVCLSIVKILVSKVQFRCIQIMMHLQRLFTTVVQHLVGACIFPGGCGRHRAR